LGATSPYRRHPRGACGACGPWGDASSPTPGRVRGVRPTHATRTVGACSQGCRRRDVGAPRLRTQRARTALWGPIPFKPA
jgi:hypothetical protein